MVEAQFTLQEIMSVAHRRRKIFLLPFAIVSVLSLVGAFVLPPRYESSTSILVQREEILNPLIGYEIAVTLISEDRLRSFNEIINSSTTIQSLIDSLGLEKTIKTEAERQALIKRVRRNISTDRRGSDSFSIAYLDTDPVRAQRAVSLLAKLFIQTKLYVENRRNDLTVQFFQKKLDEYREKFEANQNKVVSLLKQRIDEAPRESRMLYTRLEGVSKQVGEIGAHIKEYQRAQAILRRYPESFRTESGKQTLYELQRADLPYASELRTSLLEYDEYRQRYRGKYPAVEKLESQILDLLERMEKAVEFEIARLHTQRWDLEKRQVRLVDQVKRSSVSQKVDQDVESNYSIYRGLYDEMKVKLEHARMTRDLGMRGENQFIIIDPAVVPTEPSRPNRLLIILGGLVLGAILGMLSVIAVELLDTTVRTPRDIEMHQKRVIAYIPDTQSRQERLK